MFNYRIRQLLLLLAIMLLSTVIIYELYVFIPGFLGAITLYVLSRDSYKHCTESRRWKKGLTAILFLLVFLVCIGIPIYLAIHLLTTKIKVLFANPAEIMSVLESFTIWIKDKTGREMLSETNIEQIQKQLTGFIPVFLNNTATVLGNLIMILFLSYFMLIHGERMEKALDDLIPLKEKSIDTLASETKNMVKANAIGIPLISIIQGLFAMLGYWVFGVEDYVLWGFLTGLFAFFPVLGTMVIWVPLVIFLFSSGSNAAGIGLLIYSLIITGNVDYVARISLLKRIGDVHPLVTVLGLIVGLKLFGFWGFIFGPLMISYLLLLLKIYKSEFGSLRYGQLNKSKLD